MSDFFANFFDEVAQVFYKLSEKIGLFFYIAEFFQNISNTIFLSNATLTYSGQYFKNYLKMQYVDGPFDEKKTIESYEEKIDRMMDKFERVDDGEDDKGPVTREEAARCLYYILDTFEEENVGENN